MDDNFINFDEIIQNEIECKDTDELNKKICNKNFVILHVNIRSLNENHKNLEVFINNLINKPSVIVCTETWIIKQIHLFNLPDYKIFYNESKINKADGVVLYIRNDISQNNDTKIIEIDKIKFLVVDLNINDNEIFRISAIYRSHDIPKTEFILSTKRYITENKNVKNHCIVGDFNIDIMSKDKYEKNINQEFLNNFLANEFLPCFQGVTRPSFTGQEGTCIDNFYIKTNKLNVKSYKISNPFNDHYPLFININNIRPTYKEKETFQKINYEKLKNIAKEVDWNMILSIHDPNCATDEIISKINQCVEQASTVIKQKRYNRNKPRKKWITEGIIISCRKKELLYNIWKQNKDSETLKKEYANYVKILNRVIKDAKIKYERERINENSNDTKKLWKIIKEKIGKNKKKDNNKITSIIDNGNKIEDKTEIANIMNSYYCNVGKNLSKKIVEPDEKPKEIERNPKSIFVTPTNAEEIRTIINQLKNKAGGEDKINANTLKAIETYIALPLAHIFNLAIEKSIWPDALKSAEVIPIYKAGKKTNVSNYRPISLISNIAKIFEKIMYNRLYNFLKECKIFSEYQYGFMKNIGTVDALCKITDLIYKNLDKSKPIIATFLDLAKAFDTVNHELLLEKLEKYGIRGSVLELIRSYLSDRKQRVRIDDKTSTVKIINTGVPQGTILGPLFFIIYMNDLLIDMPKDTILSYADDTAIIVNDNMWSQAQDKMNILLNKVAIWLAFNKLSLNISKTKFMTFGNYCDSVPLEINIEISNERITRAENYKYLGIYFDYNMRWCEHIEQLNNKTKYLIFTFAKLKKFMDINTLMKVYYAFFHSTMNYGIIAWGGAYKTTIIPLQNTQTRILKTINRNLFQLNNYPLNIKQSFSLESLMYYYDKLKHMYTVSKSKTRNKSIILPKMNKAISDKNSYIEAIKIYNSLTNELKCLNLSKNMIKKKVKNFIKSK